jgi:hypothetical protein
MSVQYDIRLYTPDGTFLTSLNSIIDADGAGLDYVLRSDGDIGALTMIVPQGELDSYFNWQNVDYKIGVWRSINGAPYALDNDAMFFIRKFEYFRGYTRVTAFHALELLTRRLNAYRQMIRPGTLDASSMLRNNWGPNQTNATDLENSNFKMTYAGNLMKGIVRQNYSFDQSTTGENGQGVFGQFNTQQRLNFVNSTKVTGGSASWSVNLNLPNLDLQQFVVVEPNTNDGISKAGIQCDMGVVHELLKQLQDLSIAGSEEDNIKPIYLTFDLKAINERQFIFRTFANAYGKNRGRGEYVFSMARGNLANASMTVDRSEESTVMYSIDKNQNVKAAINRRRLTDSPFNLREALSNPEIKEKYYKNNATNKVNAWVMIAMDAVEELTKKTTRIKIEGNAVPTPNSIRGLHWDVGDIVTVDFRGYRDDYRITAVNVTINNGNVDEQVQWEQVNLYGLGQDASDEISP